ncbi:hypothetical protein CL632_02845 [bacterium]|jgi:sporulation protein YlmC with PRC-barrel domain|nr:hypothetical protein [bacterium]MDP6571370.1 PRC-barrel domain-containing protein [Patescibacteria group bacterium]|tara:strand:+ start:6660 stop:6971 length:312 start_codon:yes stop_codon:yes gene_type:complete
MLINFDDILDLLVQTQSGTQLGKVDGAIIDIDSQSIHQYSVKPAGITHFFDKQELLISRDQVISISKDKMVVQDGTYQQPEQKKALVKDKPQLQTEAVTRSSK